MYDMKALYEATSVENAIELRLAHPEAQIIACLLYTSGGSVGVDLLSVLASENLQARGSEQNAGSKQTNMLHL